MTSLGRSIGPIISNTVQIIGSTTRAQFKPAAVKALHLNVPKTSSTLPRKSLTGNVSSTVSFVGSMSVRHAHSDVTVPDFDDYRVKTASNQTITEFRKREDERRLDQKSFNYAISAALGIGLVYTAKNAVWMFVDFLNPTKAVLAQASIEVDLNEVPLGKSKTFKWRGKPLFIRHRTEEEIDRELAVDVASLRDPQHDNDRCQKPEFLIVIGVCTHLGCVPIADAGDFGGYYCPCHGSHYDAAGRIRKGPAPENLEIPPVTYLTDDLIKVG